MGNWEIWAFPNSLHTDIAFDAQGPLVVGFCQANEVVVQPVYITCPKLDCS